MAELIPDHAGPLRLSNADRYRAALTIVETCRFIPDDVIGMLLMLGLIEASGTGYRTVSPFDAGDWSAEALTTQWR